MFGQKHKDFLLKTVPKPIIFACKRAQLKSREKSDYQKWIQTGQTGPAPHLYKQELLQDFAKHYKLKTLVETGTFLGLMMEAQLPYFEHLISIELDYDLYRAALERFEKHSKVRIIHGDSGEVIHKVVPELNEPTLFWLDGHYSGGFTAKGKSECPIYGELESILTSPLNHVILIDDARCFNGTNDYPTISELETYIQKYKPRMKVKTENDVIRVEPLR